MIEDDIRFMREAIEVATENGCEPALAPIGCVIVMDGTVVSKERNHVVKKREAVAHAEIEAIRSAGRRFENGELRGATLYSTLQPCGMCTMASIWSKVGRIVYGAGRAWHLREKGMPGIGSAPIDAAKETNGTR